MNPEEYKIMHDLGESHWWFVEIRKIYFNLLDKFYKKCNGSLILDAGCGPALMLGCLKKYGSPVGIDISKDALYFSRLRGYGNLLCASVEALPFLDKSFDLVVTLEVICHLQIKDDLEALREFHRVLKKNSIIMVSVPAYDFLRSEHDEATHTRHRYTSGELKMKMEKAGFKVEKITYLNTFLLPLIAVLRLMKRLARKHKNPPKSDFKPEPFLLNRILTTILTIEAKLVRVINFPFGLSVLCIARK